VVRWLATSKARIVSSVSPKKSSLTGSVRPGTKRSRMPPRTANSPTLANGGDALEAVALQPRDKSSILIWLPGLAGSPLSMAPPAAPRFCSSALTVTRRSPRCGFFAQRDQAAQRANRRADASALGETRS
jgi:hypothetical protein